MAKKFTRLTSFVTLLVFTVTNTPLFRQTAWADPPSLWRNSASVNTVDSPSTKELRLNQVTIPADLGKIQESYQGSGPETIVLIQDAHAIPDAQKNIQRLIVHFQKEYGIDLVALEGAAAKLDAEIFKSFPDKEALKKVFQEYHERGELAGGVAAAIFSATNHGGSAKNSGGNETIYQGIEDWKLYEEGLGLYLQAMEKETEILKEVEGRRSKVEGEKEKIYSKELLALDKKLESFRRNELDLVSVMKALAAIKRPETFMSSPHVAPLSSPNGLVGDLKSLDSRQKHGGMTLSKFGDDMGSLSAFLAEIESEGQDNTALEMEVKRMAERVKQTIVHSPQSTVHRKSGSSS